MKAANNEGFINEFDGLSDVGIDQSSSFGRKRENKKKNRYQNIVPYDGKCVMLEELAGMSKLETEYINATCIDGFERRDSYIVAQGPLPATCHDFWRMVWLKEPSAIVMLTRTVENGKNKCKQYWLDNEPVHYDGLTIEVESITDLADYTVRLIKMTLLDEKRSIKHYHFKSWPDHGVPMYATDLLGLLYRVRRDTSGSPSPLLVHCSAGVGRSGTYVTIDFIVDCLNLKPTQKIDVCRVVTDLRMSRKEMVQSVLQYSLIHEAIVEAYYTQKNSLLASEFRNEFLSIASMQVGGGRIGEEHKALLRLSSCPDESDYMSALLPTVLRRKNRTSQFLPPDSVRVMLHVDDDSLDADYVNTEEGADYINASYVNSYSARKAFIVTQAPLPSTKIDMWKMVYEQNVTAIVNLAQHDEHDIYWPESGSCTYGHLKVKTTSVELKNAFLVYRLHLTKNMDERDITLFHYTAWPVDGTPSNVRGLFRMMSELDQWQKRHSGCRIVVHCCTGMGRSGVFCATYNVLEQVQNEGVVNILHVAKFLCNQRPGIIQTLEHYHSIYSLVDHYLRSDTIYSNVK
ncbi:receptor-type tyrosine-protein phosphatase alpha-like [Corticium candelabrum]|uniref:receptor-type tyrosine-protein phosphatase alpha-like n=1 Tax=Corticium candelabrum TaxID=121492 RepID=UPI002E276DBE|nr:receptor-type tyrosine-protein phosphatase alpha-like [Corticium candelabrum]